MGCMGHANIQTTMIYTKWGKDRATDRALVDSAFAAPPSSSGSAGDRLSDQTGLR